MDTINFAASFAPPHTLTLSRPSSSEKTLVNAGKDKIQFDWTWQSLDNKPPLSWTIMGMDVMTSLFVRIGEEQGTFSEWKRQESGIPEMIAYGESKQVKYTVNAIATELGVVIKLTVNFLEKAVQDVCFDFAHLNGWVVSNKGWVDGIHNNLLLTMNQGRADRIIAYATGGDDFLMFRDGVVTISGVPMSESQYGEQGNSTKRLTMMFKADGKAEKTGYILLPYKKYFKDIEQLSTLNYQTLMDEALQEWSSILNQCVEINIADEKLKSCYYACIADMFVLRERIDGKYYGISAGSNVYRSVNSAESLLAVSLMDRLGYRKETDQNMKIHLDCQDENGCWLYSAGWEHEIWGVAFNKANFVLQHYLYTGDIKFLRTYYKRMKASSLFNHKSRCSTKKGDPNAPYYGLMPRGMGDCGMMNGNDYYGYFYPWNCLSVASDKLTYEVALILKKNKDAALLKNIYEEAKSDLLRSIRKYAITDEKNNRWIPAVANEKPTSLFGSLYAYYPSDLLEKDDPLIQGTINHIEQYCISKGGLPVGTGWLPDGIWAAMALNDIAETYLRMGDYDKASQFIYPVLNHASPFVTWCEERGAEVNSENKSGDWQHLWTPVSVVQYILNALYFETKQEIHLAAGIDREWLSEGKTVGINRAETQFGIMSYSLTKKPQCFELNLHFDKRFKKVDGKVYVHLRTNEKAEKEVFVFDKISDAIGNHIIKINS